MKLNDKVLVNCPHPKSSDDKWYEGRFVSYANSPYRYNVFVNGIVRKWKVLKQATK